MTASQRLPRAQCPGCRPAAESAWCTTESEGKVASATRLYWHHLEQHGPFSLHSFFRKGAYSQMNTPRFRDKANPWDAEGTRITSAQERSPNSASQRPGVWPPAEGQAAMNASSYCSTSSLHLVLSVPRIRAILIGV
ncbi:PREDICTED: uncharacterized protein LOC105522146 [Colobus angolensis palliatus]|uniref:uncharacterized protein LOC105522146 n=1 Tax=Colobus angolensis palliatus TaxID=336983 RepID=UPI0005F51F2B|nr:PREDICTED: uncharacterized protein LOC105522146 [Colobus angolensis palliatus]